MLRFFDLVFSLIALVLLFPVMLVVFVIGIFDTGSPLFFQERVGLRQKPFTLVKFRTMHVGAPSLATHLSNAMHVTGFGRFLRRTKLDELPQLWNVLIGEMSLVGPRPCLPNQYQLIEEREKRGVFGFKPGITGLAQIRGVDMSNPEKLAEIDRKMIASYSIKNYFYYVLATAFGAGAGDRIK